MSMGLVRDADTTRSSCLRPYSIQQTHPWAALDANHSMSQPTVAEAAQRGLWHPHGSQVQQYLLLEERACKWGTAPMYPFDTTPRRIADACYASTGTSKRRSGRSLVCCKCSTQAEIATTMAPPCGDGDGPAKQMVHVGMGPPSWEALLEPVMQSSTQLVVVRLGLARDRSGQRSVSERSDLQALT